MLGVSAVGLVGGLFTINESDGVVGVSALGYAGTLTVNTINRIVVPGLRPRLISNGDGLTKTLWFDNY